MALTKLVGKCGSSVSTTLQATGTANGSSRAMALDRARAQAQTLLDAMADVGTQCPAECPAKAIESEPDFDLGAPTYTAAPDLASVLVCTIVQGRIISLTCAKTDPTEDPASGGA